MPLLRWLLLCVVLPAVPLHAAQLPDTVPARSLAAEYGSMDGGKPAFVHTPYATETGFLLAGMKEVLIARHNVLTPSGELAASLSVGVAEPPLGNLVEVNAVPVAQDLARDLVLLRLAPGEPSSPSADPVLKLLEHAALPCDAAAAAQPAPRRAAVRAHRRVRRERRPSELPTVAQTGGASLRVVWDGPAHAAPVPTAATATTAMERRPALRIVRDGPLPQRSPAN